MSNRTYCEQCNRWVGSGVGHNWAKHHSDDGHDCDEYGSNVIETITDVGTFLGLRVVENEHTSGVKLQTVNKEGDESNFISIHEDELVPTARALIAAYEGDDS